MRSAKSKRLRVLIAAGLLALAIPAASSYHTQISVQETSDECREFREIMGVAEATGEESDQRFREGFVYGYRIGSHTHGFHPREGGFQQGFRAGYLYRGCLEQAEETENGEETVNGDTEDGIRWFHEYPENEEDEETETDEGTGQEREPSSAAGAEPDQVAEASVKWFHEYESD